jgi:hypothetical protein
VHWSIKTNLLDSLGGTPYTFLRISTEDNLNQHTVSTSHQPTASQQPANHQ